PRQGSRHEAGGAGRRGRPQPPPGALCAFHSTPLFTTTASRRFNRGRHGEQLETRSRRGSPVASARQNACVKKLVDYFRVRRVTSAPPDATRDITAHPTEPL